MVGASAEKGVRAQERAIGRPQLETRLLESLSGGPEDAATWRLIGRVRRMRGEIQGAWDALQRSLVVDPQRASTHFEMGLVLLEMKRSTEAAHAFERTIELAPESEYARQAGRLLVEIKQERSVIPAAFEFEPNRVDSVPVPESSDPSRSQYGLRLETGAMYNSNVSLAPLSRLATGVGSASPQAVFSSDLDVPFWEHGVWRVGGAFDVDLTWNDARRRAYDLQSLRPAATLERVRFDSDGVLVGIWRTQYDFSYDAFALETFGRRHGVTTSRHWLWADRGQAVLSYRIDYSDFADDGVDPSVTSFDGWTHTMGLLFSWVPSWEISDRMDVGVDLQVAPLEGSLYSYYGVYVYTATESPFVGGSWWDLQLGWGYRAYYRSAWSQDEVIYRAAAELVVPLAEHWRCSSFVSYDRFGSQIDAFRTGRLLAGVALVYER